MTDAKEEEEIYLLHYQSSMHTRNQITMHDTTFTSPPSSSLQATHHDHDQPSHQPQSVKHLS